MAIARPVLSFNQSHTKISKRIILNNPTAKDEFFDTQGKDFDFFRLKLFFDQATMNLEIENVASDGNDLNVIIRISTFFQIVTVPLSYGGFVLPEGQTKFLTIDGNSSSNYAMVETADGVEISATVFYLSASTSPSAYISLKTDQTIATNDGFTQVDEALINGEFRKY